jgi:hypothetical protein
LEPILENTQLRNAPYKKNDIYRILMSLVNPSMQRKVHPTTKRIVTRILEDWWEKLACNTPPMMFTARYNSMHSLDSSSGPATPDSVVQVHRKDNAMTSSSLDMDTVHL